VRQFGHLPRIITNVSGHPIGPILKVQDPQA